MKRWGENVLGLVAWALACVIFLSAARVQATDRTQAVVVTGKHFPAFLGRPLEELALYRYTGTDWESILYQIDEKVYNPRTERYDFILDAGRSRRDNLPIGNDALDAQDEIVLMSGDAGKLAPPGPKPFSQAYEVKIDDPLSGQSSVVYVAIATNAVSGLPRMRPYVRYLAESDTIQTDRYETRFLPNAAMAQGGLVLHNGMETSHTNVLDRFKMRFFLDIRHFFNLHIQEENVTSRVMGYKAGPIRVIRRLLTYQKLGPIRVTPKAVSDYMFYWDRLHVPSTIFAPFDAKNELNDGSAGFGGFDFGRAIYGASFYSESNPKPVKLDGAMSDAEKRLNLERVHWWVVSGEQGHVIVNAVFDPKLEAQDFKFHLHYKDDALSSAPPEQEGGEAMVGFEINPRDLPKGSFQLDFDQIFPPKDFKQGQEALYLSNKHHPRVTVGYILERRSAP